MAYILQKTYQNGFVRQIAVLSVAATEEAETVFLHTEETGVMVVCKKDDGELWRQLQAHGLVPA